MNLAPQMVFKSFNVKPIMKIGFTLIVFIVSILGMEGANRYSVATGNWNSTATWSATSGGGSGASVPVAGDFVYIERNFTVTTNAATACASVTVASGSTLNVGAFDLIVSGTTTINGTIVFTSGTGTKTMGNVVMTGGT